MIRLNKNMKLNQTAKDIVSPQFLRRYEKGECDISFGNLMLLLSRLNISVDEFVFLHNEGYHIKTIEELEFIIDEILIDKDIKKWQSLLAETKSDRAIIQTSDANFNEYIEIIVKAIGKQAFDLEIEIDFSSVTFYLEKVETWGKYEFFLANNLSQVLDKEELLILWKQAFSKRIKSVVLQRYSVDFYLHVCIHLLRNSEIEDTKKLLDNYEKWQQPEKVLQTLSYSLFSNFIKGIILILEHDSRGFDICYNIIGFFIQDIDFINYGKMLVRAGRTITKDNSFGEEFIVRLSEQ